eukprot:GHVT01097099.1.p1 GENE.GHVT01097099.1~~GHVT01097099.1.p1  ORF type:complete len:1269 (+),score=105.84 GHVT01097099.1:202-4008(+)
MWNTFFSPGQRAFDVSLPHSSRVPTNFRPLTRPFDMSGGYTLANAAGVALRPQSPRGGAPAVDCPSFSDVTLATRLTTKPKFPDAVTPPVQQAAVSVDLRVQVSENSPQRVTETIVPQSQIGRACLQMKEMIRSQARTWQNIGVVRGVLSHLGLYHPKEDGAVGIAIEEESIRPSTAGQAPQRRTTRPPSDGGRGHVYMPVRPFRTPQRYGSSRSSDSDPRVSTIELLKCMIADTAALTIQRNVRGYRARKLAAVERRRQTWLAAAVPAALFVQAVWRGWSGRLKSKFEALVRNIQKQRREAAIMIQSHWRRILVQFRVQVENLTLCIMHTRADAARELQRVWRGYRTRKVLDEDWSCWVIKWVWDPPGTVVEVVGDFSNPPWTTRHLMRYCHVRQCHTLSLERVPGCYELKFIVDGRYVCDGGETVISDGGGHFNNMVRVQPNMSSPLGRIRERLHILSSMPPGTPLPPYPPIRSCDSAVSGTEMSSASLSAVPSSRATSISSSTSRSSGSESLTWTSPSSSSVWSSEAQSDRGLEDDPETMDAVSSPRDDTQPEDYQAGQLPKAGLLLSTDHSAGLRDPNLAPEPPFLPPRSDHGHVGDISQPSHVNSVADHRAMGAVTWSTGKPDQSDGFEALLMFGADTKKDSEELSVPKENASSTDSRYSVHQTNSLHQVEQPPISEPFDPDDLQTNGTRHSKDRVLDPCVAAAPIDNVKKSFIVLPAQEDGIRQDACLSTESSETEGMSRDPGRIFVNKVFVEGEPNDSQSIPGLLTQGQHSDDCIPEGSNLAEGCYTSMSGNEMSLSWLPTIYEGNTPMTASPAMSARSSVHPTPRSPLLHSHHQVKGIAKTCTPCSVPTSHTACLAVSELYRGVLPEELEDVVVRNHQTLQGVSLSSSDFVEWALPKDGQPGLDDGPHRTLRMFPTRDSLKCVSEESDSCHNLPRNQPETLDVLSGSVFSNEHMSRKETHGKQSDPRTSLSPSLSPATRCVSAELPDECDSGTRIPGSNEIWPNVLCNVQAPPHLTVDIVQAKETAVTDILIQGVHSSLEDIASGETSEGGVTLLASPRRMSGLSNLEALSESARTIDTSEPNCKVSTEQSTTTPSPSGDLKEDSYAAKATNTIEPRGSNQSTPSPGCTPRWHFSSDRSRHDNITLVSPVPLSGASNERRTPNCPSLLFVPEYSPRSCVIRPASDACGLAIDIPESPVYTPRRDGRTTIIPSPGLMSPTSRSSPRIHSTDLIHRPSCKATSQSSVRQPKDPPPLPTSYDV